MAAHTITSLDQLRELYRQPSERVQAKKTADIDDLTKEVIERSPFFLFATSSASGACDVSPRGGPPGQVRLLDGRRVAFPDLNGNNLLDSLTNVIENPQAGLLLLTPGRDETLRIDGQAHLTTDPDVLGLWDNELRTPKVAVVIDIESCFIHCAKAFRRAELWDPSTWTRYGDVPDYIALFLAHTGTDGDVGVYREAMEEGYVAELAMDKPEDS